MQLHIRFAAYILMMVVFLSGCETAGSPQASVAVSGRQVDERENEGRAEALPFRLSQPDRTIDLPDEIDEISGIAYDAKAKEVLAIDDNEGDIFRISLDGAARIQRQRFDEVRDYEDLVVWNNRFYVLVSDGSVVQFPNRFPDPKVELVQSDMKGKNEFEILFKDPRQNRLLMVCKECSGEGKGATPVYAFDLNTNRFGEAPVFTLSQEAIERAAGRKTGRFKPSAAAVDPVSGDIYMLSSVNKVLVVLDTEMKVKMVAALDKERYQQPEGICFTPEGDLVISNEKANKESSTILVFKREK